MLCAVFFMTGDYVGPVSGIVFNGQDSIEHADICGSVRADGDGTIERETTMLFYNNCPQNEKVCRFCVILAGRIQS